MARFHFNLRSLVDHATAHAVVSQRTLRALRLEPAPADQEPASQGPGWFESSWELIRGLDVREGLPGDARLNEWLAACLRADLAPASTASKRGEPPGGRRVSVAPHAAVVDDFELGDAHLAPAVDVAQLDPFSGFGIDGLELA